LRKRTLVGMQSSSALGRPIVWSYPSNRFAVIGSAVGAVIVAVLRMVASRPVTIGNLFGSFMALFLAWAVAREIDPAETISAGIALVVAALAILQFGFASIWLVVGALLGVRAAIGTVGVQLTWIDAAALAVLAGFVGYRYGSWIVVVVLVVGAVLAGDDRKVPAGVVVAAAGVAGLVLGSSSSGWSMPNTDTLIVMIGVVASIVILSGGACPVLPTDVGDRLIEKRRLDIGRAVAAAAVVISAFQTGLPSELSPVAAALLAAGIVRLVRYVQIELAG